MLRLSASVRSYSLITENFAEQKVHFWAITLKTSLVQHYEQKFCVNGATFCFECVIFK